jgi:hypothetical protein
MLKDQFGVDIARLMQAKTDAATASAENTLIESPSGTKLSKTSKPA